MTEMTMELKVQFYEACRAIIAEPKDPGNMPYAKTYAKAGLQLTDNKDIKVQCLYIVSNLSHWRGKEAKTIRTLLKKLGDAK